MRKKTDEDFDCEWTNRIEGEVIGSPEKFFEIIYAKKINCSGHDMAINWDDTTNTPYFKVDDNTATFFAVSSDNNAIKLNWTGNKIQVFVNGQAIGYIPYESG